MCDYIDVEVLEVIKEQSDKKVGGFKRYNAIKVKVVDFEIIAYYTTNINVEVKDLLRVKKCRLTNSWVDFNQCVLYLQKFSIIEPSEFKQKAHMSISIYGTLVNKGRQLKRVGCEQVPFYSCALRLNNGRGKLFSVLLVAFEEHAYRLSSLQNSSSITVRGNLCRNKVTGGYEINVKDVEERRSL